MSNDDENENEGHIGLFADTDPNAILLDEKMRSGCNCKSKKCYRSFDTDALINHDRLTMREFDKNEKDSYLVGKLDQCCVKAFYNNFEDLPYNYL